jgi:hypothetical protein
LADFAQGAELALAGKTLKVVVEPQHGSD